jgi:hypothetical protein
MHVQAQTSNTAQRQAPHPPLTDGDWCIHTLHIPLLNEYFHRLLAQLLHIAFFERLAALELQTKQRAGPQGGLRQMAAVLRLLSDAAKLRAGESSARSRLLTERKPKRMQDCGRRH